MMLEGFQLFLSHIWVVPLGVLLGMFVGGMPGLTSSGTLAMLLPILMALPAEISLMLGVSMYAGAEMGNSFPSVMLNIPGTPAGAVTCFDGYPMMLRGEAARALGICIMASMIGALFGGVAAITLAPTIALVALRFGPAEICIVILFGLAIIAQLSAGGVARGLLAGFFGLLLATTGTDPTYGQFRGTFDIVYLFDRLPIVAVLIGLLGFSEVLVHAEKGFARLVESKGGDAGGSVGWTGIVQGFRDTVRRPVEWLRASAIGVGIGAMPGAGGSVATFVAYQQSAAFAPPERKKQYGKGAHEGLIAADASNNAMVGGALVPLLTLGIPGSGSMAVLLVVMSYHGLYVGPRLFTFSGGYRVRGPVEPVPRGRLRARHRHHARVVRLAGGPGAARVHRPHRLRLLPPRRLRPQRVCVRHGGDGGLWRARLHHEEVPLPGGGDAPWGDPRAALRGEFHAKLAHGGSASSTSSGRAGSRSPSGPSSP